MDNVCSNFRADWRSVAFRLTLLIAGLLVCLQSSIDDLGKTGGLIDGLIGDVSMSD